MNRRTMPRSVLLLLLLPLLVVDVRGLCPHPEEEASFCHNVSLSQKEETGRALLARRFGRLDGTRAPRSGGIDASFFFFFSQQ